MISYLLLIIVYTIWKLNIRVAGDLPGYNIVGAFGDLTNCLNIF